MPSNMPTTQTAEGVCNMALGHLKITRQISLLATEQSQEAVACRTFYDIAKLTMLEDFKWPAGTTQAALALIEDNPFPFDLGSSNTGNGASTADSEWQYAYQYPSNCVNFMRIISGIRNESRLDRVPFRIVNDGNGNKMILTDMDSAFGEWTTNLPSEESFTGAMILALSYRVAFLAAPMLTGGDPFKLGDKAQTNYEKQIRQAQANALNEEQPDIEPESEFVIARGYRSFPWNRWRDGGG